MLRLRATEQFKNLSFNAVDAAGNKAPVEGVKLQSSNPDIVAVTDNGDGTFLVATTGKLGEVQLNAEADGRIGEGEKLIFGTETVEVVPGEAASFNLNPGEATERPI